MIEIDPIDEPDFSIDRPEFNPLSVTIIVPLVLIMLMLTYVAYVVYDLKLLFLLPQPWNQLIWIPYAVCLTGAIHFCNRKQQAIREAEASLKEML